jgi:uncharacterized membrane protein YfcA
VSLAAAFAIAGILVVAGGAQGLSGFGFSLICVPVLVTVLSPSEGVTVAIFIGLALNVALALRHRDHARWPTAGRLIAGAVVGMPVGLAVLVAIEPRPFRAMVAVLVLVATVLIWRRVALPVHGPGAEVVAGVVSGALNTSTSMNGPPLVLTLQGQGMPPSQFRGTLAAVLVASNVITSLLLIGAGKVTHDVLLGVLIGGPAAAGGLFLGEHAFRRIDPARFRAIVLWMLVASAVVALVALALTA